MPDIRPIGPDPETTPEIEDNPLDLWGGVEYTHNRVRDRTFDQVELSGHAHRLDDYQLFAALGIRSLRFGLLWERFEQTNSWTWSDERLQEVLRLGMRPIAGLLHHGSGPKHTNLLDPQFPEKLAAYAGRVAEHYPWLDAYTPINEPNTTARFSALYGIWYPHASSRSSYLRALLNQLKGTVLSMRAIRRIQPEAQLIQTDDVGRITGTSRLRDTWELLNERQWLPYDLLCGRVDRHHPLFSYMLQAGIPDRDILWFQDNPCPPSIVGLNYYVTSDRFLDHRLSLYPRGRRSAEGRFVDVEAVRVRDAGLAGVGSLLSHAWTRYGIPVAVTEVHIGCSVDEQIRWLADIWQDVAKVRREAVDCVALTVWALLGSFYWNQLVTRANGHYEPGVFEVIDDRPVPTPLSEVVAQIGRGEAPNHPFLESPGWWRSKQRTCFPCGEELAETAA